MFILTWELCNEKSPCQNEVVGISHFSSFLKVFAVGKTWFVGEKYQ